MAHKSNSQISVVLRHWKTGAELNPLEELREYGVYRLGAHIYTLKQEGYNIRTRIECYTKPSGSKGHYAVYRLEDDKE